jgi:hypothetical protein
MSGWLPEDIRGGWYRVPAGSNPAEAVEEDGALLQFGLDGEYAEYEIEGGQLRESEVGEFTFDGSFLILRGGRTVTYRAEPAAAWHLDLESKSDESWMLRGLFDPREVGGELDGEQIEEIRRTPAKVLVRSPVGMGDEQEVVSFVDETPEGASTVLGAGCRAWLSDDHSSMWVGVTPTVDVLSSEAWRAIVREAFLDAYLGETGALETVSLQLFGQAGSAELLEFRYQ